MDQDQVRRAACDQNLASLELLHQPTPGPAHANLPQPNYELASWDDAGYFVHDWILFMHSKKLWDACCCWEDGGLDRSFQFSGLSSAALNSVVTYLYTRRYDTPASIDDEHRCLDHLSVMEWAEDYNIDDLRKQAEHPVVQMLRESSSPEAFKLVVKCILLFDLCRSSIRETTIREAFNHAELLMDNAHDSLINTESYFVSQVMRAMSKRPTCPSTKLLVQPPDPIQVHYFKLRIKHLIARGQIQAAINEAAAEYSLLNDDSNDDLIDNEEELISAVVMKIAVAKQREVKKMVAALNT